MIQFVLYIALSLVSYSENVHQIRFPNLSNPVFAGVSKNHFFVGDYHQSLVYRYKDGSIEKLIDYGAGQGPGEFRNPRAIYYFPKHQKLVVLGKFGDAHLYDSETGVFERKIIDMMPFDGSVQWDGESFLFAWSQGEPNFKRYRFDGTLLDAWSVQRPDFNQELIYDKFAGFAMDARQNLLVGHSGEPKVWVTSRDASKLKIHPIKPPLGYEEPPKKKLSRSDYLNRDKMRAYLNSFSFVHDLAMIDAQHMIVFWHLKDKEFRYDIYRTDNMKLVRRDIKLEGHPVGFAESSALIYTASETGDEFSDDYKQETVLHWQSLLRHAP